MGIFDAIKGLSALQKAMEAGKEIKDPAAWKDRQVLINKVGIILVALTAAARAAGLEIPQSDIPWQTMVDYATEAVVGVMMLVNIVLTFATSKKVGK